MLFMLCSLVIYCPNIALYCFEGYVRPRIQLISGAWRERTSNPLLPTHSSYQTHTSEVSPSHVRQSISQRNRHLNMATAALKKIATEVEKVAKGVENASRKGKKPKQGEEDLDNKALTGLVINLKNALEQLVAYVGKEENFCPKLKDQEKRTRHLEDLTDDNVIMTSSKSPWLAPSSSPAEPMMMSKV